MDVSPTNSTKKELTSWLGLIHFIFAIFYLNLMFLDGSAENIVIEKGENSQTLFLFVTESISSACWIANRRLLSVEKKKSYPQSKLTHRWFWPASFVLNFAVLFCMFVFY